MKPLKNRVYCPDCGRSKMFFESEEKALKFMEFNNQQIQDDTGRSPIRAYYCKACCGWHLTSHIEADHYIKTNGEKIISAGDILQDMEHIIVSLENEQDLIKYCINHDNFRLRSESARDMPCLDFIHYNRLMNRFSKLQKKNRPSNTNNIACLNLNKLYKKIKSTIVEHNIQESISLIKKAVTLINLSEQHNLIDEDKNLFRKKLNKLISQLENLIQQDQTLRIQNKLKQEFSFIDNCLDKYQIKDSITSIKKIQSLLEEAEKYNVDPALIEKYKKEAISKIDRINTVYDDLSNILGDEG